MARTESGKPPRRTASRQPKHGPKGHQADLPDRAKPSLTAVERAGGSVARVRQCCCSEVLRSSSTHALSRSIAMTLSSIVRSISARRHSSTADKIALTRLSSASSVVVVIVVVPNEAQAFFKRR
jgi:hypothetical protein